MLESVEQVADLDHSLGEWLLGRERLDAAGLDRAQRLARGQGERLDRVLTKLGLVSERDMAEALAELLGLALVRSQDYPEAPVLENEVSTNFLKSARVIPLAERDGELVLAMADPLDDYALKAMQLIAGRSVVAAVAVPAEIETAIDRIYGTGASTIGEIVEEFDHEDQDVADEDVERLKDLASEAPVIRLVNLLINKAVEARASDIHIETFESRLRVRYRVDGVLEEVEAPPNRFRAAVISRIKIMAKLNIAERRLPQDGRIKLAIRGKEIDLRVSVVPSMHGEGVVLRVLDRDTVVLDFASLGLEGKLLESYLGVLDQPHGIVLVTGPTGSGKTTSLYTSLMRLNVPSKKIVTVEDPIEYHLEGVNQIQVKPGIGLSFANVLRSILRHDPDIIMIGEIRDLETAQIAVQAALTGHVVLSTLHTNNAAGTVSRLLDMGVEDYLLTSTLNGVVAQRLVRRLCGQCREPYQALPEFIAQMRLQRFADGDGLTLCRAPGCEQCNGTGFLGRLAIAEMLVINDPLRQQILRHAEAHEIHRAAVAEGMVTMYENGIRAALSGVTSIEEVLRVTRDV
ncbi:MAG: type II secretion system ATPase GspE [Alphaproteobacteria bacterium]